MRGLQLLNQRHHLTLFTGYRADVTVLVQVEGVDAIETLPEVLFQLPHVLLTEQSREFFIGQEVESGGEF